MNSNDKYLIFALGLAVGWVMALLGWYLDSQYKDRKSQKKLQESDKA